MLTFKILILCIPIIQGVVFPRPQVTNNQQHLSSTNTCPASCQLPSCSCGLSIPGGLSPEQTPQFVLLTWDDAVNDLNKDFFSRIFSGRINPDGCPSLATFYVSHEWTDYGQVQDLYSLGHEIASHTITHSHPPHDQERWALEVVGQAKLLAELGNVKPEDVKGMRAPFLQTGGDDMFTVLREFDFLYDSSLPASDTQKLWPYTLNNPIPHSCHLPPCPTGSHPGMWEIPMNVLQDDQGNSCPMLDGCRYEEDAESIQRMLTRNFLKHYSGNKAPFPMFYHAAWFRARPHREEALVKFLDSIQELPDVYLVTSQQLLEWVMSPTPLPHPVITCQARGARTTQSCGDRKQYCEYGARGFFTCNQCPSQYPWV